MKYLIHLPIYNLHRHPLSLVTIFPLQTPRRLKSRAHSQSTTNTRHKLIAISQPAVEKSAKPGIIARTIIRNSRLAQLINGITWESDKHLFASR